MRTILWLLAVIVGALGATSAQDAHLLARFHGKVTDEQGAVITVAAVLVHPDRQMTNVRQAPDFGQDIRLEVNQKGEFSAVLTPGLYDIVAFASVFSPQCAKIRVTEGSIKEHNFVLLLEPAAQTTTD
jgi:hypothetical protein